MKKNGLRWTDLKICLELSGWLLEETDLEDPAVGEGISQVFLISRYYPFLESNLFAKVGGGCASVWNNRPGEPRRKNGWGLVAGGGYDFPVGKNFALSPFASFSYGEAEDLTYKAVNIGVCLSIQSSSPQSRLIVKPTWRAGFNRLKIPKNHTGRPPGVSNLNPGSGCEYSRLGACARETHKMIRSGSQIRDFYVIVAG